VQGISEILAFWSLVERQRVAGFGVLVSLVAGKGILCSSASSNTVVSWCRRKGFVEFAIVDCAVLIVFLGSVSTDTNSCST
jgi:hypothetical protein